MKKIISGIKVPKSVRLPKVPNIPGLGTATDLGETLFSFVMGTLNSGVGLVSASLGGIPFFGKTARSQSYDHGQIDEKHYFLVPDPKSEKSYSLYVMRCLPEGVPPINNLPKRRLLHLPSEHALPMLHDVMMDEISQDIKDTPRKRSQIENNLVDLVDEIDKLDSQVFKGVLLIGGLVAMVNPLAGATVAMKAMVPAAGMIASKHGLKFASDKMTNMDISRKIKKAEKDLQKQFKESSTSQMINPVLKFLDQPPKRETWMMEREKFKFACTDFDFSQGDQIRFMDLTRQAIEDVRPDEIDPDYFTTMREFVLWH